MRTAYVVRTPTSIHLFDDDLRVITQRTGTEELTLALCSEALTQFDDQLRDKERIVVEEEVLKDLLEKRGLQASIEQPSRAGNYLRSNVDEILGSSPASRRAAFKSVATEQVQERISVLSSSLDQELIALVYAHDTLAGSTNEVTEKLVDLVSLYFPELKRISRSTEKSVELLSKYPSKEEMMSGGGGEIPQDIMSGAFRSRGAATPSGTAAVVKQYAATVLAMNSLKEAMARRISDVMGTMAPNVSAVAGPLLGAKLVAKAGGLMKLAKLPSSSVQVMGAEKALFRAMKEGGRPPKHGLIFQHPLVHNSPRKLRGKVARALASKISIASRIDTFSGSEASEELVDSLRKKIESISVKAGAEE